MLNLSLLALSLSSPPVTSTIPIAPLLKVVQPKYNSAADQFQYQAARGKNIFWVDAKGNYFFSPRAKVLQGGRIAVSSEKKIKI